MRARSILFLITALLSTTSFAQKKTPDMVPMYFQADKNNIQILPQRFEYNLVDEDHIKIGDIVIDSTTFGFQVAHSVVYPGKYRARFIWPAGLLKDGLLTIRDNTGKAVWTNPIRRKNIHLIDSQNNKENNLLRTQLAELIVDQLEPSLIEDMKYFPFMSFCINRSNLDTRIYLCSKDVYLTTQEGHISVRARSQGKRTPFVEINGKSVGNQGIIFLNDEKENIGFRAMTQSGAILEVETRMKPVDFKDVVLSDDQKNLILTASGTEPVNEDKVKRISEDEWQFNVDMQRPILYLKGEGDIPMRQEFYIKGAIPAEKDRPFLDKASFNRVYKQQLELHGKAAEGTSVNTEGQAQQLDKNGLQFRWNIDDIPGGQTSRHYLRVNDDKNSFIAAYDIYRDFAYEAGLIGSYWTPAGEFYATGFFSWWIENFFGSEASWARLHWGLLVEESMVLTKKNGEANANLTHLELLWRAEPGFHFIDTTWGLVLPYEMKQATGVNIASPGLGAFYSSKAPKRYKNWFDWYDAKFIYLLGGGSDVKLKNALELQALAYIYSTKQLSWNYGLGVNQYNFDPGTNKMQFELLFGSNYRF